MDSLFLFLYERFSEPCVYYVCEMITTAITVISV